MLKHGRSESQWQSESKQFTLRTNNGSDPNSLNCNNWEGNAFKCKSQNSKGTVFSHAPLRNSSTYSPAADGRLSESLLEGTLCQNFVWGFAGREKHSAKKMKTFFFLFCFLRRPPPFPPTSNSFLTAVFLLFFCLSHAGDTITQLTRKASLLLLFQLKCVLGVNTSRRPTYACIQWGS